MGGQKELIKDSSYLIPTKNPDILADRLHTLYKNRELRERLGSANYETAKKHNLGRFQRKIERVVLSAVKD
ncbi:unnamed protein product [marine sediment metagenome]|uniref:Glycosyl transferase family 1 domain-containing protein n=1 Tax=marine sediment metagenome TaxID=412755 RepID=X0W9Y0_9ZZZZ